MPPGEPEEKYRFERGRFRSGVEVEPGYSEVDCIKAFLASVETGSLRVSLR